MPSPEVIPPVPLQRAQERGLCLYGHLTLQATIPPGRFIFEIKPPVGVYACRNFALTFGALEPAGISPDFIITHRSGQVVLHEDPWIHSIVDWPYPLTDTITEKEPHVIIIDNKTGVDQTFDVTLHWMEFRSKEHWDRYRAMVEEPSTLIRLMKRVVELLSRAR